MKSKKTLVLGASLKAIRYSNKAIIALLKSNYEVVAIGLREGDVSGVKIETAKMPFLDIHTVTLYLKPKNQEAYFEYIIQLKPKRVIFNPGTENLEFIELLKQYNIETEVACTLVLLATQQY